MLQPADDHILHLLPDRVEQFHVPGVEAGFGLHQLDGRADALLGRSRELQQCADQRAGVGRQIARRATGGIDLGDLVVERGVSDTEHRVELGVEVVEEGAHRHTYPLTDLLDGDLLQPLLPDQLVGGINQRVPPGALLPLTETHLIFLHSMKDYASCKCASSANL